MKTINLIGEFIIRLIGRDNGRFYGLLLFIALMFALWLLYQKGGPQHSEGRRGPARELVAPIK